MHDRIKIDNTVIPLCPKRRLIWQCNSRSRGVFERFTLHLRIDEFFAFNSTLLDIYQIEEQSAECAPGTSGRPLTPMLYETS